MLVTGGTGFLGTWCIAELLSRGYEVRTTVRDLARVDAVRGSLAAAGVEPGDRLSILAADLTADDGWADAVAGCDYVLHVASPFPPQQPKDPDELIVPARDGALRVLRASLAAGVKRVVMTSSVAAVRHGRAPSAARPYDETDWTDGNDPKRTPYVRSKAIAERAAWEHVKEAGAEDRLATVNPGAIIGPTLSEDRSYSLQTIERLLGGLPAVPRDDLSRCGRRAIPGGRSLPLDAGRRADPARATRARGREGPDARRAQPADPRDGSVRSECPADRQ